MTTKVQSALLGALIYTVLGLVAGYLALNGGTAGQYIGGCGGCIAAIVGPLLAVWHYTSTNRVTMPAGAGAGLGAMAGVLGAVISGGLQLLLQSIGVFPTQAEAMEQMRTQMLERGMTAEQIQQAMSMTEAMTGNPLIGIVIGVVIGAILGAIFGAIGAAIFKKGAAEPLV